VLIFDEVTDKTKLAPFFMAHGVVITCAIYQRKKNNFSSGALASIRKDSTWKKLLSDHRCTGWPQKGNGVGVSLCQNHANWFRRFKDVGRQK